MDKHFKPTVVLFACVFLAVVAVGFMGFREHGNESASGTTALAEEPTSILSDGQRDSVALNAVQQRDATKGPVSSDLRSRLATVADWTAELRGQLSRLPVGQQVDLVTDTTLRGLDAARWASRIRLACLTFLQSDAATANSFVDTWCAELSSNRRQLESALKVAEEPLNDWVERNARPIDDPKDPKLLASIRESLIGENIDRLAADTTALVQLGLTDQLGIDVPHHMTSTPFASFRIGEAAGVLLACQAEGFCGWNSTWVGQYCVGFGVICEPGLALDQQVALNTSSHEQRVIREVVEAVAHMRRNRHPGGP